MDPKLIIGIENFNVVTNAAQIKLKLFSLIKLQTGWVGIIHLVLLNSNLISTEVKSHIDTDLINLTMFIHTLPYWSDSTEFEIHL